VEVERWGCTLQTCADGQSMSESTISEMCSLCKTVARPLHRKLKVKPALEGAAMLFGFTNVWRGETGGKEVKSQIARNHFSCDRMVYFFLLFCDVLGVSCVL
jgi:hypothetical protein